MIFFIILLANGAQLAASAPTGALLHKLETKITKRHGVGAKLYKFIDQNEFNDPIWNHRIVSFDIGEVC